MAGRQGKLTLQEQKAVFFKYSDRLASGIPPVSDEIYELMISDLLDNYNKTMSAKAIQMSLKRYKSFFFDYDQIVEADVQGDDINSSYYRTVFEMDIHEFKEIAPQQNRLKKNQWTNELQDQIYKKTDLRCTFAFKNNYAPTDFQCVCNGKCTQCGATLVLTTTPISENFISVVCELDKYKPEFNHDPFAKTRLTSNRVSRLKKKLQHNKALAVRASLASEVISVDDYREPPTLPSLSNLRKIRHRVKSALHFAQMVIISIYAMACSAPYDTFIHKFSLVPLILYFWTTEQSRFYNDTLKNSYKIITIDATGSIFQPISPPVINHSIANRKVKHIFLYAIMAYTTGTSIPLCYMASQSHTTKTIARWLKAWAAERCVPNEIVCDDSSALLGAIAKIFTKTNIKEYLLKCFLMLEGQKTTGNLQCYIRLDKSHFIKKLYKQSCFDKVSEKVKFFYINCIRLIQQLHCYDEIKLVLKDIITLAAHRNLINNIHDSQTQTKQEEALKRLQSKIKKKLIEDDQDYEDSSGLDRCKDDIVCGDLEIETNQIPLIIFYEDHLETENLYGSLAEQTQEESVYYFPELHETLKRLLKKLPLWGNIMNKYFKGSTHDASSSNVENHFKDIKRIYFNTKDERIRLDEFLVQQYSFINGSIRLASCDYNKNQKLPKPCFLPKADDFIRTSAEEQLTKKRPVTKIPTNEKNKKKCVIDKVDFEPESIFQDKPVELENWRGLTIPRQQIKKNISKPIFILRNGNISNFSTNRKIVFTNTCAFDSVAQTFGIAYLERHALQQLIDNAISKEDLFSVFIKELTKAKITQSEALYRKRDTLLSQIFPFQNNSDLLSSVDCACNVTKIFDFLGNYYVSAYRKRMCTYESCTSFRSNDEYPCKYLPVNMNLITEKGVCCIQEAVETCLNNDYPACHICDIGCAIFQYNIQDMIVIELHDCSFDINDVPINIELNNKKFHILSIIEFKGNQNSTGHYTAHCYRENLKQFQCYDDLNSTVKKSNGNIIPHAFVYTGIR